MVSWASSVHRIPGMISVLCPTRNRPDNIKRLLTSLDETTDVHGLVEVVFRVDNDALITFPLESAVSRVQVSGPRCVLSQMWNECYAYSSGEIVMQGADDIVFRTQGWDSRIRNEFDGSDDKILLAYGDDYLNHGVATHGFIHHRWPDALGYFTPPYFSCDYADTWLTDLARRVDRLRYIPEIVTEHMHPTAGKAPWDQTHADRTARGEADRVADIYADREEERIRDAEILRSLLR